MKKRELEERYQNSLVELLKSKIFTKNENMDLVQTVGNQFIEQVNADLMLKDFTMKQDKTGNVLLFTIQSEEKKIVEVVISTESVENDSLKINDVLASLYNCEE